MNDLKDFICSQLNIVPQRVYVGLGVIFCIGIMAFTAFCEKKTLWAWLLLVEYVFFLYCQTVLYRPLDPRYKCLLTPFWSYISIFQNDNYDVLKETIMNVALFMPIGFILGILSPKWSRKQKWITVLLVGLVVSVSIELLQLFFKKGFVEFDDVLHNTLGCALGFVIYLGFSELYNHIKIE